MAHGMVTHTKSAAGAAADHIQTGIQTSAKVVASVPGSIVNVGTGLLQEGQSGIQEVYDSIKALGEVKFFLALFIIIFFLGSSCGKNSTGY